MSGFAWPVWATFHCRLLDEMQAMPTPVEERCAKMQCILDEFIRDHGHQQSTVLTLINWIPIRNWNEEMAAGFGTVPGMIRQFMWKRQYGPMIQDFNFRHRRWSACTLLALADCPRMSNFLIDNGADVNHVCLDSGSTCLMDFVSNVRIGEYDRAFATMLTLLNSGADPNRADARGLTALAWCWLRDLSQHPPRISECLPAWDCFAFGVRRQSHNAGSVAQLVGLLVLAGADPGPANSALAVQKNLNSKERAGIPQHYLDRGVALAQRMLAAHELQLTCLEQSQAIGNAILDCEPRLLDVDRHSEVNNLKENISNMHVKLTKVDAEMEAIRTYATQLADHKDELQAEISKLRAEIVVPAKVKASRGKRAGQQVKAKQFSRDARVHGRMDEDEEDDADEGIFPGASDGFQVIGMDNDADSNSEIPNTESVWS